MSRLRNFFTQTLHPYFPNMNAKKAEKMINFSRMLYFLSASGALFYAIRVFSEAEREREKEEELMSLQMGRPIIKDTDRSFAQLRKKGVKEATIAEYHIGEGVVEREYNEDEYYKRLEEESMERARKAQEKLLAEGKPLPPGAIRLV